MNHIYRSIWSEALATWIAVSENSKGRAKSSLPRKKFLATSLFIYSSVIWALPTGEQVVTGEVAVSTPSAGQMSIQQSSQQAIVNWQGFSINANEAVNIYQPNASAVLLNRVVGQDASLIQGQLNANGHVYVVNPNGVLFGKTAQVDVGGLVASTLNINDADFLAGNYHFNQDNLYAIVDNQGYIRTNDGGIVVLIGTQVSNSGFVETLKGTSVLAAGKTVDLDFKGSGLVEVKVSDAALNAQVENKGAILADAGRVILTAKAAQQLAGVVINSAGLLQAKSLVSRNGEIILDGGDNGITQISGKVDVSGQTAGGKITVTGKQVNLTSTANLNAQVLSNGKAGEIKVLANMQDGVVNVAGKLDASALEKGDGGFIETSAARVNLADDLKVSTLAAYGKTGEWLIDPTDFTITDGTAYSSQLLTTSVTLQTSAVGSDFGDLNLNAPINWSANTLTLDAHRNININANLNGSGTAKLVLKYAQASTDGSSGGDYFINNTSKINLSAGQNFSLQKGSDAANVKDYTVITDLGAPSQAVNAPAVMTLQGMAANSSLAGNYVLGADIDASATSSWFGGKGFDSIGDSTTNFTGNFDGLGHVITNLTINRPTRNLVGLFGFIAAGSTINNIGLEAGNIIGSNAVGYLAGENLGNISNAYATGSVTGTNGYVGGLIGANLGNIKKSYATATVNGELFVGGLVGGNDSTGKITYAYATANVTGKSNVGGLLGGNKGLVSDVYAVGNVNGNGLSTDTNIGGLIGGNDSTGVINNAYAIVDVTSNSLYSGGLVGGNAGKIDNAYAKGSVISSADYVGGLIGANKNTGSITHAYATGSVTGTSSYVGGLIGGNEGDINNTYAIGGVNLTANAVSNVGGLIGGNTGNVNASFWNTQSTGQSNSASGIGKTTAQMMQQSTFSNAGWNISNAGGSSAVWRIYEGYTTPLLRSFLTPLTITANNISKIYDGQSATNPLNNPIYSVAGADSSGYINNLSTPYFNAINVGVYNHTLYSDNQQKGYDISYIGGTLTINPATLTYQANNSSRVYGAANLIFTGTVTGFVNNESLATATSGVADFSSTANNNSNVGIYAINGSGLVANNGNYIFTQATSNATALSITPATLTYTATAVTRTYGADNPVFSGAVVGFMNADTLANATSGILLFSSNVDNRSNIGNYSLTGSGLTANNYIFTQAATNATALSITPAILTYIADPKTRVYGTANPEFTGTIAGFVNQDTKETITTGSITFSSDAISTSIAGYYAINGSGLTLNTNNYILTQAASNATALNITSPIDEIVNNNIAGIVSSAITINTPPVITTSTVDLTSESTTVSEPAHSEDHAITAEPITSTIAPVVNKPTIADVFYGEKAQVTTAFVGGDISEGDIVSVDPVIRSANNTASSDVEKSTEKSSSNESSSKSSATTDTATDKSAGSSQTSTNNTTSNLGVVSENSKPAILPTLTIKNSAGRVKDLQISANRQFLSLLLEDGSIRVWDFQRGVQRQIVPQNKHQALTDIGAVDNDGESLPIAGKGGIGTYEIISSSAQAAINNADISHFVSSTDGNLLLVNAGVEKSIFLWDNKYNSKRWKVPFERGIVNKMIVSDDNRYGAALSSQYGSYLLPANLRLKRLTDAIDIFDLKTGKIVKSLPNLGEQVVYMQFKDNETLQLGLANGEFLNWSLATGSKQTIANFTETITAVDTLGESYAYILRDGSVQVSDGQGQIQLKIQNKENSFKDVKLLENGNKLLTVMASGDLALWDVNSGKKLLRLFSLRQGWTVMDAFGRFDGSEEALQNFSWLANEEDIPLDSFSENYYEPGLLTSVLQDQNYLNDNSRAVKEGISLPPKVVLQLSEQQSKGDNVAVQVDVYDRGSGINNIRVYQNGKMLSDNALTITSQSQPENDAEHRVLNLNVTASAGKNTLKVIASNNLGIENSSQELSFDGKTKAYTSSLRLLTVGINKYQDSSLDLNYSVADASAIGEAIKRRAKISISRSLFDENATKAKILAELKELSQGSQQDALVVYFAGHGIALGKEWYFMPHETRMSSSVEQIIAPGITATELSDIFKNSKIQHILLIVDSCHSGGSMDVFSQLQNGQRYFTRQLSRSLGITVVTAAAKDQQAAELKSLGHGLFTYLMTQEIENTNTTSPVTAHSVAANILKTLPAFSQKMIGVAQEPVVFTHGNDFILTDILKESSSVPIAAPAKKAVR